MRLARPSEHSDLGLPSSLRNRKFTSALTVLSIALAVVLLLGVERIRQRRRASPAPFRNRDLIVSAQRSVHLLLYSVFGSAIDQQRALGHLPRIGEPPRGRLDHPSFSRRFAPRIPRAWNHAGILHAFPLRS